MTDKRHYIKNKKKEVDICNICGQVKKLTWDHVPPKSSLIKSAVYANTLFKDMPTENDHMKAYQSGIKYRTICKQCNNVVLGENDKEYKAFIDKIINSIAVVAAKNIYVPKTGLCVEISCKINRILRAVCGHLLAAKEEYNQVEPDVFMREYVLDETLKLEKVKLFSWIYPYSTIVLSRDFVCRGYYSVSHPEGFISVISCFPISFILSTKDETECILDDLGQYSTENIDDVVEVRLHLDTVMHGALDQFKDFNWPVDISNEEHGASFVLCYDSTLDDSRLAVRKK